MEEEDEGGEGKEALRSGMGSRLAVYVSRRSTGSVFKPMRSNVHDGAPEPPEMREN